MPIVVRIATVAHNISTTLTIRSKWLRALNEMLIRPMQINRASTAAATPATR